MPRFPAISEAARAIAGSVYSNVRPKPNAPPPIPLHVGDTWMEPAVGCRMQDLLASDHPGLHRYSPVAGLPKLRRRIAEFHELRSGCETHPDQVLVTAGATAGLAAAVAALVNPGDEVLLAAPHWPLIAGAVRAFAATPVSVPVMTEADSPAEAVAVFERYQSPRTVAVYWNTPHNPTGRVLDRAWLAALTDWAKARQLWIFADEVYEDYVYADSHCYTRSLAVEAAISVHSFSKAYGMAGNRCGYLIGPQEAIAAIQRIATNINYSACTASQWAALHALSGPGLRWAEAAREGYAELGRWSAQCLGLDAPGGSTFLFPRVSDALDERGLDGLLGDLADVGVLVAPGPSFGPYPEHLRICFTAAEPSEVKRGVERLAALLR